MEPGRHAEQPISFRRPTFRESRVGLNSGLRFKEHAHNLVEGGTHLAGLASLAIAYVVVATGETVNQVADSARNFYRAHGPHHSNQQH